MPTRPQTWRFQATYDGFEHGGLRTEFDRETSTPLNRAGRVVRVGGHILDADGRRVGHFTRMLATGRDGLRARHEEIRLAEEARGRGFARALHEHAEAVYVRMGVGYVTMHAEDVGSLLWPRLGFDFDLRRVEGETEAERRAHAVLRMLSPRARKIEGQLRPAEVLAEWLASKDPAKRTAAAELRERLPTPAKVARGDLGELLLDPRALGEFDAEGTGLGRILMLGASWDGYKRLPGPVPREER
jgi:ribosomal protein S18 acetylase RimI-like enzyme